MARWGAFICDGTEVDAGSLAGEEVVVTTTLPPQPRELVCKLIGIWTRFDLDGGILIGAVPELVEQGLKESFRQAGLDPFRLVLVDLRGRDAVGKDREIKAALARARHLEPVAWTKAKAQQRVLIIGGGAAGLQTALGLRKLGLPVVIVEQEQNLGGRLTKLDGLCPWDEDPQGWIRSALEVLQRDPEVEILSASKPLALKGQVGDFTLEVQSPAGPITRRGGAVVLALGSTVRWPQSSGLEPGPHVVGLTRLDELTPIRLHHKKVAFLLDEDGLGSRLGTLSALRSALRIKDNWGSEVHILCRNLKVDGKPLESMYRKARDRGVVFFKYEELPRATEQREKILLQFKDPDLDNVVVDEAYDLIVLEEEILPAGEDLGRAWGVLQPANVHLYPVETNRKGIYMVGGCRDEMDFPGVIQDGTIAAGEIGALLGQGVLIYEEDRVRVETEKCVFCLTCVRLCPHQAAEIDLVKEAAFINPAACQACGMCAANCPAQAIDYKAYDNEGILAQLEMGGR